MTDVLDLDATAQADLIREGEVSPRELAELAIARIELVDPAVNAVIHPRFERAIEEAAQGPSSGPFAGVPILLKDLGCHLADEPAHSGNALLRRLGHRASTDAELTRRIRAAGFTILGRTNVPEFGLVNTTEPTAAGQTHNPWAPGYSTGGSSGGSAAAVATGMVPIAQATDGGGSIRMPASHCGVFGLKPSRGRISTAPDGDDMEGHNVYGFLTRTVRDSAAALDFAAGYVAGDSQVPPHRPPSYRELVAHDPQQLRIGVLAPTEVFGMAVEADVRTTVLAAADTLSDLGHEVISSHPSALFDPEFHRRWQDLLSPSITALFGWLAELKGAPLAREDAEEMAWWWYEAGARLSAVDHIGNQAWRDGFRRRLVAWWADGMDVLLGPVLPMAAPRHGYFSGPEGLDRSVRILGFTPQFNMSGQPAASVPFGSTADGRPIGIHLVGHSGREDLLFQLAGQLERAHPWVGRRPGI